MSSATVLDSIIEGVRADVAAREAATSLAEVKAKAKDAAAPLDVLAALRVARHRRHRRGQAGQPFAR